MTAPAMRVLMRERFAVPQLAAFLQRLGDVRVGVEHALSAEEFNRVEKMPGGSDRRVDFEPVLHPGLEVVGAVARRGVNRAGTGFERHVGAQYPDRRARV